MTTATGSDDLLYLEDFTPGRTFEHHWGRTVTESDVVVFTTQTHLYEPAYLNADYARHLGHTRAPAPAGLVLAIVLGLTVEDLSESGGSFLGATAVRFPAPVHVGDTLHSASVVVERRDSARRPGWGVVTWRTVGTNQHAESVIEYRRTRMVRRRTG